MSRISSGIGRRNGVAGGKPAAMVDLPSMHGDSGRKCNSPAVISNRPFPSVPVSPSGEHRSPERADTGLVTFAVYECDEGARARVRATGRMAEALRTGYAASRKGQADAPEIRFSEEGRMAGCDAGKGAIELAAGSLAWREYLRGSMNGEDAVPVVGMSERSRLRW
jgi:hypothetical protein